MTTYTEKSALSLLTGATDLDGDAISVRRINGAVIASWPHQVVLPEGRVSVTAAGVVTYDDEGDIAGHPPGGQSSANGSFTFTLWDGTDESPTYTCSVQLNGATVVATGPVSAGLVARWAADQGVTLSGADVIGWTDVAGGRGLSVIGTPKIGAAPTGAATMVIEADEGFTGANLAGFPTGAAARTMVLAWKPTGNQAFYSGFGYGANNTDQATTISVDIQGTLAFDVVGSRTSLDIAPTNEWNIVTVTYDGTHAEIWLGCARMHRVPLTLNTGSDLINVCRSFSGKTTTAEIGEAILYNRVLSDAEILTNTAYLNDQFIGATTVATPAPATGTAILPNGFTANGTGGATYGSLVWAVTTSASPLSAIEIKEGTGAVAAGVVPQNGASGYSFDVTGLAPSTDHYVHVVSADMAGLTSAPVTSAAITTATPDTTAPVLSAASGQANGANAFTGSVTTDEVGGSLFWTVYPASAPNPSPTQILAGQDGTGASATQSGSQPVGTAGPLSIAGGGLVPDTGYRIGYAHRDASNNLSLAQYSNTFTTNAGSLTLKQQITLLRDDLTTNGRQSTAPLKVPGQDSAPGSWTISADGKGRPVLFINNGFNAPIIDWDFRGLQVYVRGGADVPVIRDCLFGETQPHSPPYGFHFSGDPGCVVREIGWSSFYGPYEFGGADKSIQGRLSGSGTNITVTDFRWIHHCRFEGMSADSVKLTGTQDPAGQLVEYCYVGPSPHLDNAPQGVDPHGDGFTVVCGKNGITMRQIYIEMRPDPANGAQYDPLMVTKINNGLRIVRNNGTDFVVDFFNASEFIIDRARDTPSYAIHIAAGGQPNMGPTHLSDGWISYRNNNSGADHIFPGPYNLQTWSNIRDLDSDAIIPQP